MESRYTLSIVITEIKIEGFERENKVVSSLEKPGPDTCKLQIGVQTTITPAPRHEATPTRLPNGPGDESSCII